MAPPRSRVPRETKEEIDVKGLTEASIQLDLSEGDSVEVRLQRMEAT